MSGVWEREIIPNYDALYVRPLTHDDVAFWMWVVIYGNHWYILYWLITL